MEQIVELTVVLLRFAILNPSFICDLPLPGFRRAVGRVGVDVLRSGLILKRRRGNIGTSFAPLDRHLSSCSACVRKDLSQQERARSSTDLCFHWGCDR